jgi:phage repressor protein C with HTH and peptisase S24 domain
MERKGLNPNQLAVQTELKPATVHKALAAGKGLHSDTIATIVQRFPELDADWLLTGKGRMMRHDTSTKVDIPTAEGNIIALRSKVAAGLLKHQGQREFLDKQPRMALPGERFRGGGLLAIQVTGDSMEPTILDGDWLVVRKCDSPKEQVRPGQVYVVVTAEGASAKRLRVDFAEEMILCESDNPDVAPYTIKGSAMVYDVLALIRENPGDQRHSFNVRLVRVEQDVAKLKKR